MITFHLFIDYGELMAAEDYLPEGWESEFYGSNWKNDERMLPEHLSCKHSKRKQYKNFDICLNCFAQLKKITSSSQD